MSAQGEVDPGGVSLVSLSASSGTDGVVSDDARVVTAADIDWLVAHLRVVVAASPMVWAGRGMTLLQLSALAPLTLTDLAQALGTRPQTTSAMVDRLTLTADAEPIVGDTDLDTARRLQAVLTGMSPQTHRHLIDMLIDTVRRSADVDGARP